MATITITLPFEPGDTVYVVWNNLIQKGTCKSINANITKTTVIIEDIKAKVDLASSPGKIVYIESDQVFLTPEDAAQWLEENVIPPPVPET